MTSVPWCWASSKPTWCCGYRGGGNHKNWMVDPIVLPLVNSHSYVKSPFVIGKSTIMKWDMTKQRENRESLPGWVLKSGFSRRQQTWSCYFTSIDTQHDITRHTFDMFSDIYSSIWHVLWHLSNSAIAGFNTQSWWSSKKKSGLGYDLENWGYSTLMDKRKLPHGKKDQFSGTCFHTSSTAQGSGRSFKDRKFIGEDRCCKSWTAKQIH